MSTIGALGNSMLGIQRGLADMQKQAATIAAQSITPASPDIVQPLVQTQTAQMQVAASLKVLEAVNQTVGSILDITV